MRILAIDTSTKPGIALLEVKKGRASILDLSSVTTNSKQPFGLRFGIIEAWAVMFIERHYKRGFDEIIREDYVARTSRVGHPVFAAWGACDSALHKFGLEFTAPAISPTKVKSTVAGSGKAEKPEVEAAVRKWTGYEGEFKTDDESDAAAVGLAYLILKGAIK